MRVRPRGGGGGTDSQKVWIEMKLYLKKQCLVGEEKKEV